MWYAWWCSLRTYEYGTSDAGLCSYTFLLPRSSRPFLRSNGPVSANTREGASCLFSPYVRGVVWLGKTLSYSTKTLDRGLEAHWVHHVNTPVPQSEGAIANIPGLETGLF